MMTKLAFIMASICVLSSFAATTVETTQNGADSRSSARITITGEEAKKMIDYLGEVSQYTGSFVAEDGGMGKYYISGPGITCRTLNMGHVEPEDRDIDRLYSCEISFGANGSVNL